MKKNPPAFKPECQFCEMQSNGECRALASTTWLKRRECPFLATRERLQRDFELRKKAIEEGRVIPHQYG
jgi:hypothetical protein